MASESDSYITVIPAVQLRRYNVVVMRWDGRVQEHTVFRTSEALNWTAADSLAQSWAAAMNLEVK